MKVLVPIKNRSNVFSNNLFRAPHFALYTIDTIDHNIYCTLHDIISNPYYATNESCQIATDNYGICDKASCTVEHLKEHAVLGEHLEDCDYILAVHFCDTMIQALNDKGINIYKISPFLHSSDIAIKNFLLGVSFANTIQNIYFRT